MIGIGEVLDNFIGVFAPAAKLRRMQARRIARSYQGAEPNRLTANRKPKNQSADQELLGPFGADSMRAWARELVRNNSYAWGVVDTIVSSVVGCGIKAQSTYETPEGDDIEDTNEARDKAWREWCEVCDINGQYTFDEIQSICQREIVEAGEVLIRLVRTPSKTHRGILRPVPLALELIEADRLAGDKDTYHARVSRETGNRMIRGVEVDDLGKPIAYWLYPDHPNGIYSVHRTAERIPASEVLHLFRRDRIGQTRGISWFAPVLSWLRDLGVYVDNELQASAVASCFTVAIKSETPIGSLLAPNDQDTVDTDGNAYEYLQPGMVMRLRPNESIESANPGRPNSASEPWISLMLRGIAVGTGLSYEIVARDYSKTNYSSSRTSQLEDRRRFRRWQRYLLNHMCQPIWDAFCDAAAISGMEEFPTSAELLEDRRKYAPVEWQTPEWEWVDPQSEQASAEQSIKTFMSDYQTELGSRGRSYRAVFYQRAKEERLRKQLGLLTPEEMQIAATAPPAEQQAAGPEAATTDVASQALNGAQVTSLVEVITQIGTGALPKDSAKAIVSAAFPTISQDTINSIVDPIEPGSIMADGSPVAIDTANAQSQEDFAAERGTGEMGSLSTLQFNRNRKAILKTLEDLAAGALTEAAARVFLSSIGLSQANIDALIADASDGTIETNLDEVDA
jgi:lambda family phage portal protein